MVNHNNMDTSLEETDPSSMEYALKRSLISRSKLAIILKNATTGETEYCCVECSAKYNEKEQLELHLCMHNKQYRFLCGICGTGLKRKEHLDRHLLEHNEVRPHKCPDCGKGFKRKEHLNIHKTIHKGEKTQVCTLCDRSFNRKDHLQKHLQTHGKFFLAQNMYPIDDQEALEMAGEEYVDIKEEATEDYLKSYEVDASFEDYEMESSDPLDASEPYADDVEEPSADVLTPDAHVARPFMCPVCFKSYKRRDHLKIHSWTHMKKDKICAGCGKGFHKETQLAAHRGSCVQEHIRLRTEQLEDSAQHDSIDLDAMVDNSLLVESTRLRVDPESRPHECVVCHRRFKRKQHLKVHANVHLKQEASIWCSLCNEGFVANKQFEQHQCRAGTQPGAAATPEAKKENKYPGELFVQEMIEESPSPPSFVSVQDEQNIPVPQRVFVCRFCQKPFKRRDHYKIHLHIHTGVKDFFCPDCGKGFYRKDHLQKHSQTHTKPKPKPKKQLPGLYPISLIQKKTVPAVKPEITITAPSNTKLRVPLQIKVPYQVVQAGTAVTVDPHASHSQHEIFT